MKYSALCTGRCVAAVFFLLALTDCGPAVQKSAPALAGERALVLARSGLTLRARPDASSPSLGLAPYKAIVTISEAGPEGAVQDSGATLKNRWYRADYGGRTGWLFGGFLFRLRNIELTERIFSDGSGCDPLTYSEYSDVLRLEPDGTAARTLEAAHDLGGPCAGVDTTVDSGQYRAENGVVTVHLTARSATLEYFENNDACPKPPVNTNRPLQKTQRFYTGQCADAAGVWQDALFNPDAEDGFLVLHENPEAP
jgi:hypothetical protein